MIQYFQRYYYYIDRGIHKSMIAPQNAEVMKNVASLIPNPLLANTDLHPMVDDLSEEVNNDYEHSIRKSIGKLQVTALVFKIRRDK